MTSTGVLIIVVGIFILVNTFNIVGVLQGNKSFGPASPPKAS